MAFLESFDDISTLKDLTSKKLCIIKTDFKNLSPLKYLFSKYPNLEIWLTSKNITRENLFLANKYNVKKVLQYPFDKNTVTRHFKNKNKKSNLPPKTDIPPWIRGMKIMVVDNNPLYIETLRETLEPVGAKVTFCTKTMEAVEKLQKEKFDLFIMDINLPEMSGFELAELIKKTDTNSNSQIMFMSELSGTDSKIRAYNLGAAAFSEKPFDVNIVRAQVVNILKTKQLNESESKMSESFLAMIMHDLKTPVNAQIAALEQLSKNYDKYSDEHKQELINETSNTSQYMKNLVDDYMTKHRFDNDAFYLDIKNHSFKKLVEESVVQTKYLVIEKNQSVKLFYRAKAVNINMDYLEVKRVIQNLLANAVDNAPKSSEIEIDISENKKFLVFSIKNVNGGRPIQNPNDLFHKFVSNADKSKRLGTGLGLYIAKRIVVAHGGTITVDVKNPQYVRFVFTLPK